ARHALSQGRTRADDPESAGWLSSDGRRASVDTGDIAQGRAIGPDPEAVLTTDRMPSPITMREVPTRHRAPSRACGRHSCRQSDGGAGWAIQRYASDDHDPSEWSRSPTGSWTGYPP